MPTQSPDPTPTAQQQHVVASPNPTIDDSKGTAAPGPAPEVKTIRPAQATKAAPMKSGADARRKARHRRKTSGTR